jgi:putative membrane protein
VWLLLAALVLVEISYPLLHGPTRAYAVAVTVVIGFVTSVGHALITRGWRTALLLVAVTAGGGFAVEAVGVATCVPFGCYAYGTDLGPHIAGVIWLIPLAWTWMAWPAWLVAGYLCGRRRTLHVVVGGVGLASWDLFLDPQMVDEQYWIWADPQPALPLAPGVPIGNYLGWLLVALVMMAVLAVTSRSGAAAGTAAGTAAGDGAMFALYLWTYASSVLAHAVFLGLPGSALWGSLAMGAVAVPLAVRLWLRRHGRVRP